MFVRLWRKFHISMLPLKYWPGKIDWRKETKHFVCQLSIRPDLERYFYFLDGATSRDLVCFRLSYPPDTFTMMKNNDLSDYWTLSPLQHWVVCPQLILRFSALSRRVCNAIITSHFYQEELLGAGWPVNLKLQAAFCIGYLFSHFEPDLDYFSWLFSQSNPSMKVRFSSVVLLIAYLVAGRPQCCLTALLARVRTDWQREIR